MYEPTPNPLPQLAFLWPAFAAASASEAAALMARQFAELAGGGARPAPEPNWNTPNSIALGLKTVRLRDFSTATTGTPTLLCAPFALHGAGITDLAPDHSLVTALRKAGLRRLHVTDWRPADETMRDLGIDDYLATLNVLVDHVGAPVDLIGLCQGGWLALIYAARFPAKVRKLVLVGAPIDITAAPSGLSQIVAGMPTALFEKLVRLGNGRVIGRKVQKFWGPETIAPEDMHRLLEVEAPLGSDDFLALRRRFQAWYAWTLDLPGPYYLEGIDRIFKRNALADGKFIALGERIDLSRLTTPLYLLAARDDELIAPEQLFALSRLSGTAPADIRTDLAPCRHLGLFMGRKVLRDHWPAVADWLTETETTRIDLSQETRTRTAP
ncbi:MAG: alpha/beta fold hydrolase [Pseudolabrys sp.]